MFFDNSLKFFSSSLIDNTSFFAGFGTRSLGDGRKADNIIFFLKKARLNFSKILVPRQIHSTNIFVYEKNNNKFLVEKIDDIDGLITKEKNVVLTAVTADCVPLIFIDEKNKIIGISHQGWRGTIKRMPQKMVNQMDELGACLDNIKVLIGPSIGECCYDIDEDRYFEFRSEFDGYSDKIFKYKKGRYHLNLSLLNYLLLLEKGVKKENIDFFPFCTKCDKNRFFSFRRYKEKKGEEYGEMFSLVVIKN